MADSFARVEKSERGYHAEQVDAFLAQAREAFSRLNEGVNEVTAESIRTTAFGLAKGGYDITAVDEALERLERVFYQKEREHKIATLGQVGWDEFITEQRDEVLARLNRDAGKKFKRAGFLRQGYSRSGVDEFAATIVAHFTEQQPLSVDQVRKIAFIQQSNGYHEAQVDILLDRVIELLLDEELRA